MILDYEQILKEVSENIEEEEELTIDTIDELTNGKGEDEDE